MKKFIVFALSLALMTVFTGCEKNDEEPIVNDEKEINEMGEEAVTQEAKNIL
ncbi:hypothetical protein ACFL21_04090 [Patescibacteria group bacterium]